MEELEVGREYMKGGKLYRYLGGPENQASSFQEVVDDPPEDEGFNWSGLARKVGQGLTFGFGDEIESAVTGRDIEGIRGDLTDFGKEHPIMSLTAEMAGGAPWMAVPGLGAAKGAKALTTAQRVTRGARAGLLAGAAYGAGTGESTGSRVMGAAVGGAGGGVLGAVMPAAGALLARGGRGVRDRAARAPLDWMKKNVGLPDVLTPQTADDVADRLVSRALMRDGVDMATAASRADDALPEERMVDLFGGSTRRAARGAMAVPNEAVDEATEFLTLRGEGEIASVGRIIDDVIQAPDVNVDKVAQGLRQGMRQRASGLYDDAYEAAYDASEQVREIVRAPGIQRIAREHKALVDQYGFDRLGIFDYAGTADGQVGLSASTSVRSLDSLKRALDDAVTMAYKDGRGTAAEGLREIRRIIVADLDDKVPAYRAARAQYAGDMEVQQALEMGRNFSRRNVNAGRLETALDGMSGAEREMFRLGWVNGLRDDIAGKNPGSSIASGVLGVRPSGNVRANTESAFRQLFPDRDVDGFFEQLQRQANMRQSQGIVLGNSQTARIQNDVADLYNTDGLGVAGRALATRGPKAGLSALADVAEQAHHSDVAGAVSRRMMLQDPREVVAGLKVDPERIRRGILWGDAASGAASVGSGLLSGRLAGTTFSNLFR